jgi:predicted Zn-ribbon and HTH transcriptional regulator
MKLIKINRIEFHIPCPECDSMVIEESIYEDDTEDGDMEIITVIRCAECGYED